MLSAARAPGSTSLKVLVLSKNMSDYASAFYQQDFLEELSRQSECRFYGPGFVGFDRRDTLQTIFTRLKFRPDLILLGHSFLADSSDQPLVTQPSLDLSRTDIPIIAVLNKEYTRLGDKIKFLNEIGPRLVLTHHHNLGGLGVRLNSPSLFVPFAVNPLRFPRGKVMRTFDLGFTGLLQNRKGKAVQPDTRISIMKQLHYSAFGYPLGLRKTYSHLRVLWRSWTGIYFLDQVARRLLSGGKLSDQDYPVALQSTKVWLNTPSPVGLVSTRYFECMASGAVVLAQESEGIHTVFPKEVLRTFRNTSDFVSVLEEILEDEKGRLATAQSAYDWVIQSHSWEARVRRVLEAI